MILHDMRKLPAEAREPMVEEASRTDLEQWYEELKRFEIMRMSSYAIWKVMKAGVLPLHSIPTVDLRDAVLAHLKKYGE